MEDKKKDTADIDALWELILDGKNKEAEKLGKKLGIGVKFTEFEKKELFPMRCYWLAREEDRWNFHRGWGNLPFHYLIGYELKGSVVLTLHHKRGCGRQTITEDNFYNFEARYPISESVKGLSEIAPVWCDDKFTEKDKERLLKQLTFQKVNYSHSFIGPVPLKELVTNGCF